VLPSGSLTVYWIGVGSPVKPGSGVKVIAPVAGLTLHVPWPATGSGSPGLVVPTICTVPGTAVSPVVSLPSTGTVTGEPRLLLVAVSLVAMGA